MGTNSPVFVQTAEQFDPLERHAGDLRRTDQTWEVTFKGEGATVCCTLSLSLPLPCSPTRCSSFFLDRSICADCTGLRRTLQRSHVNDDG